MTDSAPLPEPPPPPPIPPGRRAVRLLARAWPFVAWCAALGAAVWLYFGETGHGHALALEEVHELRIPQAAAGRIASIPVEIGQKVRAGDVIAVLDAADGRMNAGDLRILAPAAGAISAIDVQAGQWGAAGAGVVRMVVPRADGLIGFVTDRQIPAVAIGTLATLRSRDLGGPPLKGKVIRLGPQIEELPPRLRAVPNVPQWGRRVVFQVDQPREPLPGQVYEVRFH